MLAGRIFDEELEDVELVEEVTFALFSATGQSGKEQIMDKGIVGMHIGVNLNTKEYTSNRLMSCPIRSGFNLSIFASSTSKASTEI